MNTNYKKWLVGQIEEELDNLVYDLDRLNIETLEQIWISFINHEEPRRVFAAVKTPYL